MTCNTGEDGNMDCLCSVEAADGPAFGRYAERFEALTGNGEVGIWIPFAG